MRKVPRGTARCCSGWPSSQPIGRSARLTSSPPCAHARTNLNVRFRQLLLDCRKMFLDLGHLTCANNKLASCKACVSARRSLPARCPRGAPCGCTPPPASGSDAPPPPPRGSRSRCRTSWAPGLTCHGDAFKAVRAKWSEKLPVLHGECSWPCSPSSLLTAAPLVPS